MVAHDYHRRCRHFSVTARAQRSRYVEKRVNLFSLVLFSCPATTAEYSSSSSTHNNIITYYRIICCAHRDASLIAFDDDDGTCTAWSRQFYEKILCSPRPLIPETLPSPRPSSSQPPPPPPPATQRQRAHPT